MRRTLSIVFALLFILFAAFQYNDPDPEVWIPIYLFGAAASFMAYVGMGRPWFFAAMGLVYLVAAVYWWPPVFEGFLLDEMSMKTVNIELARESGGLAICAAAMFTLAFLMRNVVPAGRRRL
ncbi:transmembrane 220 family protein [Larkinella soli]|uniref:transmembrane 220 family protein n=1 Tax=Larkinella soli TaxID=1770527 RepID=UPI000FFC0685|nr:transmembrane 220 family protein [Larkinella soli]